MKLVLTASKADLYLLDDNEGQKNSIEGKDIAIVFKNGEMKLAINAKEPGERLLKSADRVSGLKIVNLKLNSPVR